MTKKSINVLGTDVVLFEQNEFDFISLTDIAKYKGDKSDVLIQSWMRNRNTVEFLGLWETLNNPNFKPHEFEGFRKEAGLNSFLMSPKKWAENTNAIGIISKSGKYGGTLMQIL